MVMLLLEHWQSKATLIPLRRFYKQEGSSTANGVPEFSPPLLPDNESKSYEHELTAFVAATELYLWKLLRRDLNYDLSQTHQTFKRLVNGLIINDRDKHEP